MAFHPYVRPARFQAPGCAQQSAPIPSESPRVAVCVIDSTPIGRQLQIYSSKINEVKRYLEHPSYSNADQKEKRDRDSIDVLALIHSNLRHLANPAILRDENIRFFNEDFMPIKISDDPTAEQITKCYRLMDRIKELGLDLNRSRVYCFQSLILACVSAQKALASKAETHNPMIESLKKRDIFHADALMLRFYLTELQNEHEAVRECMNDFISGIRNYFTFDAAPRCLEIIKETNEVALIAIRNLSACIARHNEILSKEPSLNQNTLNAKRLLDAMIEPARIIHASIENIGFHLSAISLYKPCELREYIRV